MIAIKRSMMSAFDALPHPLPARGRNFLRKAANDESGWVGCDLDGTLAYYDGFKGETVIGAPIPLMVERVKQWLQAGKDVRIFTARIADPDFKDDVEAAIQEWCLEHIGQVLPITNVKDHKMQELYDDRAVQVIQNTGVLVGKSTRGL